MLFSLSQAGLWLSPPPAILTATGLLLCRQTDRRNLPDRTKTQLLLMLERRLGVQYGQKYFAPGPGVSVRLRLVRMWCWDVVGGSVLLFLLVFRSVNAGPTVAPRTS